MANQFSNDLKFEPIAWEAWDDHSNIYCRVDEFYEPSPGGAVGGKFRARWRIVERGTGKILESGKAASPTAARRKCRAIVRTLRSKPRVNPG